MSDTDSGRNTPSSKPTSLYQTVRRKYINEKFIEAVYTRNLREITLCLMKNVDINVFGENHVAALHIVAERGDTVVGARLLRNRNTQLNILTYFGHTPLMLACVYNNRKFVDLLLSKGADPNVRDRFGQSCLEVSAIMGSWKIVPSLVRYGADINTRDCYDNNALSICLLDRVNLPMAQFLINHESDIMFNDHALGMHVFLECVLASRALERIDSLTFCLENGVDVNMQDPKTGKTCLHFIALTGNEKLGGFLLQNGADLNIQDRCGRTPLMVAKEHGNRKVYNLFANHGLVDSATFILSVVQSRVLGVLFKSHTDIIGGRLERIEEDNVSQSVDAESVDTHQNEE